MTRAPRASSAGRSCAIHASTPGPGQPDRVDHAAARRLRDTQRRVARRREHGDRLRRDRAEPGAGRRAPRARRRDRTCPTRRRSDSAAAAARAPPRGRRPLDGRSSGDLAARHARRVRPRTAAGRRRGTPAATAPRRPRSASSAIPAAAARAAATVVTHATPWTIAARRMCMPSARGPAAAWRVRPRGRPCPTRSGRPRRPRPPRRPWPRPCRPARRCSSSSVGGARGRRDREPELGEAARRDEPGVLVAIGERQEHGALARAACCPRRPGSSRTPCRTCGRCP